MNRRAFIKVGAALIAVGTGCNFSEKRGKPIQYAITIDSDRTIGHLARTSMSGDIAEQIRTDVLIVGAGIAGLAAACSLRERETIICDLGHQPGGTSSSVTIGDRQFSQGAHYDISYPSYYGREGLELLSDLDIIEYNRALDRWDFIESQYVIKADIEERCYKDGALFPSVLVESELKNTFLDVIKPYEGKMPLPTTLIAQENLHLDQITFADYLKYFLPVTSDFIEAVDYQMIDDYGGPSNQVSALAGIHYYRCRPYYSESEPEVFSPTEGNFYFIRKMMESLRPEQIMSDSLVVGLEKSKQGWEVDVWEIGKRKKVRYRCNNVIYTGQKQLLKYLQSDFTETFSDVIYAAWIVINIELQGESIEEDIWQNDYLSGNQRFLGFVNSGSQTDKRNRVLTAYYCYPDTHHHLVQDIENDAQEIVAQTLGFMSTYLKQDLSPFVKHVYVKLLGHAMPIPIPGYLSKKRQLEQNGLAFAGSDSGRLPLMFDALDSGIQAARMI